MFRNPPATHAAGLLLLLGITVVLLGTLAAVVPLGAALLSAALAGGMLVLLAPLDWITMLELLLATVIAGSAEYFAGVSQAHWVPYLLGSLLGFRALLEHSKPTRAGPVPGVAEPGIWPWFVVPMSVYFLAIGASILSNFPPLTQVLVGLKNYVFMWGVLAALLVPRNFDHVAGLIWKSIIVVSCLQLPVVLYQKFFVASRLSNAGGTAGLSWDAISGTFGGGLLGGHAAAMALFITITLAIVGVAWRDRKISAARLLLVVVLSLPSVFLAEVKAVVIWLGITGLMVFGRTIKSRPVVFLAGMLGMVVVTAGIVIAYKTMYYEGSHSTSWYDIYDKQIKYFFDTNKFNTMTREMGRFASLAFWWNRHDMSDPAVMLIGHGLGASRSSSSFAVGEIARQFSFFVDTSAATALLWDIGILGCLSFAAIYLLGALEGFRLSLRKDLDADTRAGLECSAIGLVLILSGIIYVRDSIDAAGVQFLSLFFLAVIWRGKATALRRVAK